MKYTAAEFANSADPDEVAHEQPNYNLQCLSFSLYSQYYIAWTIFFQFADINFVAAFLCFKG